MHETKTPRVEAALEAVSEARRNGEPERAHYDALIKEAVALEIDLNAAIAELERAATAGGTRAQAQAERNRLNALVARLRRGRR